MFYQNNFYYHDQENHGYYDQEAYFDTNAKTFKEVVIIFIKKIKRARISLIMFLWKKLFEKE